MNRLPVSFCPIRHVACLAILGWLAPSLVCQAPEPPPPFPSPSTPLGGSGSISANERFVYVLRGDTVYKLDGESLALLSTTQLPRNPSEVIDPRIAAGAPMTASGAAAITSIETAKNAAAAPPPPLDLPQFASAAKDSIERGLDWLRDQQHESGRWDADGFVPGGGEDAAPEGLAVHDVGVTGLAVLAFMGDGNTMKVGPYSASVTRAVDWLIKQQDPETGLVGSNAHHSFIYDHAIAAHALVEAYGLSELPRLKEPAQRAIDYIEYHRNPYSVWRYMPRGGDNDTSVTGWCAMAVRAAKDFDIKVNPMSLKMAIMWMDQITDPVNGRAGYTERGGRSSRMSGTLVGRFPTKGTECMSAISLATRCLVGADDKLSEGVQRQAQLLIANPPRSEPKYRDFCYWYWGSLGTFQIGGEVWATWLRHLADPILSTQRAGDDAAAGSWDPIDPWGEAGGRVFSTSLAVMTLQSPVRYARLIK